MDELEISADINIGSEEIFGFHAQGSYDKLTENEDTVNREFRLIKDEELVFQTGFTQIIRDTTTTITVDGYPGLVKESEYVDSQFVGDENVGPYNKPANPKEVVDLQKMANMAIKAMHSDSPGKIRDGTYLEKLCVEG